MHIGHPGNVDVNYTVTQRCSVPDLLAKLPPDAPEVDYFRSDPALHAAFPDGRFNCWGVPSGAAPRFFETEVGDVVLFVPSIGVWGGIEQIGVVKAKCPIECYEASRILWPKTPRDRLFPHLFFFDTEVGLREWFGFLEDIGYSTGWNPRGYYRKILSSRFDKWGGPEGYVRSLRSEHGFHLLTT